MNPFKATEEKEGEFAQFIGNYLELSDIEIDDLAYRIRYSKYYILKTKDKGKKSNIIYRISFPIWFIIIFLLFALSPFKWIITGWWYYEPKGIIYRIMNNWQTKLFK